MSAAAVLLVSNYSNRTGYAWNNIHRLYGELAHAMRDRGLRVLVSFARLEGEPETVDPAAVDAFVELPPAPATPAELAAWLRLIRRQRVRYIYLTDQPPVAWHYALFRAYGVRKIIVHCRVSVPDPRPALPERGLRGAAKWLYARLPGLHADAVYAVSDFVRDRLVRKARFTPNRVRTILNGIDLDRFRPVARQRNGSRLTVFVGGRATKYKGIDVLIRAVARIRDRADSPDFLVRYAGDGPDIAAFRQLVDELGVSTHFQFLGEVGSTEQLVADADIIVFPSVWGDACPSAVSEALAAGKPLIATRVGGVPELIGGEHNALLIPHADVAALAEALHSLLRDAERRVQLGERARRRAETALDQTRYHAEVRARMLEDMRL